MLNRRTSRPRPGRARDPRSLSSAVVTRFFRGTLTQKCETFRRFGRGSAQNSAREIGDLASDFASLQFSKRPARNTKRREVAAHESFRLAGPTGLEPATSGVTGRRSNQLNYDPAVVENCLTAPSRVPFPPRGRAIVRQAAYDGNTFASPSRGAAASFAETTGSASGHSMPIAGSFHANERSALASYSAVHL